MKQTLLLLILIVVFATSCTKDVPAPAKCNSAKCMIEDVDQRGPKEPVTVTPHP